MNRHRNYPELDALLFYGIGDKRYHGGFSAIGRGLNYW
jgi:hypothetical protein